MFSNQLDTLVIVNCRISCIYVGSDHSFLSLLCKSEVYVCKQTFSVSNYGSSDSLLTLFFFFFIVLSFILSFVIVNIITRINCHRHHHLHNRQQYHTNSFHPKILFIEFLSHPYVNNHIMTLTSSHRSYIIMYV